MNRCALLAALLYAVLPGAAQVFQVGAGSSSLLRAQGGSLEMRAQNTTLGMGFGYLDGHFHAGGYTRMAVNGYKFTLGDDAAIFDLPTDLFNTDPQFWYRGASIARSVAGAQFLAFGGYDSNSFGAPFFRVGETGRPLGGLFAAGKLSPKLRVVSRNIFTSDKQTAISSLEWTPRPYLKTAVSLGAGENRLYRAASMLAERSTFTVKAQFVKQSDGFRRFTARDLITSETDGAAVAGVWRPSRHFDVGASHQDLLGVSDFGLPTPRATVNQTNLGVHKGDVRGGVGLFKSSFNNFSNVGISTYVGRRFGSRLDASANWLQSRPQNLPASNMFLATLREFVSNRIDLLQFVTVNGHNVSVSYGGNLLTNWISVGVEYQTIYVPFRPSSPFQQALALNVRLRPFGNVQLNGGTVVGADGRVRYTVSGSNLFVRTSGLAAGAAPARFKFGKYVVRGQVRDGMHRPVAGAAIKVGSQLVFSDSAGLFFVRVKRSGAYTIAVLPDEFMAPGRWRVIESPASIEAAPEESAPSLNIIVGRIADQSRRRPPAPSPAPASGDSDSCGSSSANCNLEIPNNQNKN